MKPVPFAEMRHRMQSVITVTSMMMSLDDFPTADEQYWAMYYGLMTTTDQKGRGLSRVRFTAQIVTWIDHFNKGVDMLWTLHELQPSLQAAKLQFAEWDKELRG